MPLLFDMPREQLAKYKGTNPKPKDFDSYWQRGKKETEATDPDVTIKPSDFKTPFAICSDMYFTGVGGARIHAKLVQPIKEIKKHPALLMFHGYSGNAGDWTALLPYAACGYTVAAMDCRGQGGQSEDKGGVIGNTLRGHIIRGLDDHPDKLLFRQIFLDTYQLSRIVMDMPYVDSARIGATGGSQGGGLTLACVALQPKIKLAAPLFPFLCDYLRVWKIDQAQHAYEELKQYFRLFDPLHKRENEIFTKLGYIDVQHMAPWIKAEILMFVGHMDTICPPSTQFAAYNKIKSKKSLVEYPDFGHEGLPGASDIIFNFMRKL